MPDPNKKYPHGEIKPAASKIVQTWRQFKNNPKYSFHRNIATGLTFLPIGKAVGAGIKLIRSRIGTGTQLGNEYRVGNKLYGHFTKDGKLTNKHVPVVGKPGKTVSVPKSSSTQQVSYANPRISMTAAERRAAGY